MPSDNSISRLNLEFSNVILVGETLQALLIRRRFNLTKFTQAPEPEFHPEVWLTDQILTWGSSSEPNKNGFRIKANNLKETDEVQFDIEPPIGGKVVVDISFVHMHAYFRVLDAHDQVVAIYVIVVKPY